MVFACRYAKNGRAAQRLAAMWGEMGLIPKVMFDVPAAESADAKELGARFCWERKKWCVASISETSLATDHMTH